MVVMQKFTKIFLSPLVGIITYILISKILPSKVSDISSQEDLRGEDIGRSNLIKKIMTKIKGDRALKIALISVIVTVGVQYFTQEIATLGVYDSLSHRCVKEVDGQLKIVCTNLKEQNLNLHCKSVHQLITSSNLSTDNKVNLLKIQLDFIINEECAGNEKLALIAIIALLSTVCVSSITGIRIFLEALYRLFREGKISFKLFLKLLKLLTEKVDKV